MTGSVGRPPDEGDTRDVTTTSGRDISVPREGVAGRVNLERVAARGRQRDGDRPPEPRAGTDPRRCGPGLDRRVDRARGGAPDRRSPHRRLRRSVDGLPPRVGPAPAQRLARCRPRAVVFTSRTAGAALCRRSGGPPTALGRPPRPSAKRTCSGRLTLGHRRPRPGLPSVAEQPLDPFDLRPQLPDVPGADVDLQAQGDPRGVRATASTAAFTTPRTSSPSPSASADIALVSLSRPDSRTTWTAVATASPTPPVCALGHEVLRDPGAISVRGRSWRPRRGASTRARTWSRAGRCFSA